MTACVPIALIYLVSLAIIAILLVNAPEDYEEASGFHTGTPPQPHATGDAGSPVQPCPIEDRICKTS